MNATMRKLSFMMAIVIMAVLRANASESLEDEARRTGKGAIVLQVGSDWCVSGEKVRKVFESGELLEKIGDRFVLGVYDEMEKPTEAATKANERVKSLLVRTQCFPAMTFYTPSMKIVRQWDCIPQDAGLDTLCKAASDACQIGLWAEEVSKKAAEASGQEAADMYGRIFEKLLGPMVQSGSNRYFDDFTRGAHGWKEEWEALCGLDAGDKYGWKAHFLMDEQETVKMVAKFAALKRKSYEEAKDLLKKIRTIPVEHLSDNQRQSIDIMEYALETDELDTPLTPEAKALLQGVLALDGDTFWGRFARGRLILDGEQIATRDRPKAKMVLRPKKPAERISFALDKSVAAIKNIQPDAKLNERKKLEIARYAALRLIGNEGWQKLVSRQGSAKFVRAFLNDRTWLEDFAWNGLIPQAGDRQNESGEPGAGAAAILALESLVYQDNGRWVKFKDGKFADNEGRRFMTALALNYPDKDEEWLSGVLEAYRATAQAGRLHKSAYRQPVWMWRMALNFYYIDNVAGQQYFMDRIVNVPVREYAKVPWTVLGTGGRNCFGRNLDVDQVWRNAGGEPLLRYASVTGGGARQISGFAVACASSRGVPASVVVQPQSHLAFSYREVDGVWRLGYNVVYPSSMHFCFWPHDKPRRPWQYVTAVESTFGVDREVRHAADRMLALANLARESKRDFATVEKYYRRGCGLHPGHYGAWLQYESYLLWANALADDFVGYADALVEGYKAGRQPLWDLLTPYFECVARQRGAEANKKEILRLEPAIKTSPGRLDEETDFGAMRKKWGM